MKLSSNIDKIIQLDMHSKVKAATNNDLIVFFYSHSKKKVYQQEYKKYIVLLCNTIIGFYNA